MASSQHPSQAPDDLASDPELTYNPARTAALGLRTLLPTGAGGAG